eukprot:TRINITY_DN7638_c4_g1_i1.p1 TRINITY_DN7638_c4_g1~~TRINITY_DN7638_c4_g1_i1.p1  ORF type:complete len:219 (+),score=34.06 TRINITY_DN7638_c4_g1_i1:57-659(+)
MSTQLQNIVIKEGEVLPGGILRLTSFFNHQVDAMMISECGGEIAEKFSGHGVTKILTAPVSGVYPTMPTAIQLKVPFVVLRSSLPATLKDVPVLKAVSKSHTKQTPVEFYAQASLFKPTDKVLIMDDFLATGTTMLSMADIVKQSGATIVGFAVLLDKAFEGGRAALQAAYPDIPIHTCVSITSLEEGKPLSLENVFLGS